MRSAIAGSISIKGFVVRLDGWSVGRSHFIFLWEKGTLKLPYQLQMFQDTGWHKKILIHTKLNNSYQIYKNFMK